MSHIVTIKTEVRDSSVTGVMETLDRRPSERILDLSR